MFEKEMPIFTKTFDFLSWLLPATNHFPKAHRHTFSARLLGASFDLCERLESANVRSGSDRLMKLKLADESLASIRMYIRHAAKWGWLSEGQYWHAAKMVSEIGRLLGGWIKVTR